MYSLQKINLMHQNQETKKYDIVNVMASGRLIPIGNAEMPINLQKIAESVDKFLYNPANCRAGIYRLNRCVVCLYSTGKYRIATPQGFDKANKILKKMIGQINKLSQNKYRSVQYQIYQTVARFYKQINAAKVCYDNDQKGNCIMKIDKNQIPRGMECKLYDVHNSKAIVYHTGKVFIFGCKTQEEVIVAVDEVAQFCKQYFLEPKPPKHKKVKNIQQPKQPLIYQEELALQQENKLFKQEIDPNQKFIDIRETDIMYQNMHAQSLQFSLYSLEPFVHQKSSDIFNNDSLF